MVERIKRWFIKVFLTKYIIVRNGLLLWQFYYPDRVETKVVLAKSQLLSKISFKKGLIYTRLLKGAFTMNLIMSYLLFSYLKQKNRGKYKFKIIKATDAVFLSDLTGLTGN